MLWSSNIAAYDQISTLRHGLAVLESSLVGDPKNKGGNVSSSITDERLTEQMARVTALVTDKNALAQEKERLSEKLNEVLC